jgi:DNA modification methylase
MPIPRQIVPLRKSRSPRVWSSKSTTKSDWTFHQIAPYIGRMKTSMARALILGNSNRGDLIVDPFCGSGVVALEASANGRAIAAGDWNPYAVLLTRAKLFAPIDEDAAQQRLRKTWKLSRTLLNRQDLRKVPLWVRHFFHPETLRSALAFRDACVQRGDNFLLGCLLGILHHQRPGFLSFPSSHLVPYLRNKKFPRSRFARLYEERDVLSRLEAKIRRTYRRPASHPPMARRVHHIDARKFPKLRRISAVITSPPYMNELDYVRDNRLRLWFISRSLPKGLELVGRNREAAFRNLIRSVCARLAPNIKRGGKFVLIVGDATRGSGRKGRTGSITRELFESDNAFKGFALETSYQDRIPDIRRSRRECSGTKVETILIFRKR